MSFLRKEQRQQPAYEVNVTACDEEGCKREMVDRIACQKCEGDFCVVGGHLLSLVIEGQQDPNQREAFHNVIRGYYCRACLLAVTNDALVRPEKESVSPQ